MAALLTVKVEGLAAFKDVKDTLDRSPVASQRAVNFALNRARTKSGKQVSAQLNFAARYLVGQDGKIDLIPATKGQTEGKLTATSRATSLARFVTRSTKGKAGVRVSVGKRGDKNLKKAFLIGVGDHQLLAVRSKTRPNRAFKPRLLGKNLWVLYGPSVAQALIQRSGRGIWAEMEPGILDDLQNEYIRQMKLDV